MKYIKFVIANYRAITGPLEIDINRSGLIPIIGINESGKTTILHALFSFDRANDESAQDGRHLRDTTNLYKTNPPQATVQAELEISRPELVSILKELAGGTDSGAAWFASLQRKKKGLPERIKITRNLVTKKYQMDTPELQRDGSDVVLAQELVRQAPFILFFDDFRDKIEERIEIPSDPNKFTGWVAIIERLFKRTDKGLSLSKLSAMEDRQRKSALAKVQRYLNETLTKEWANFRLDDRDALEISIEYDSQLVAGGQARHFVKLDVVETDAYGDKHYFFISDRSKGFFWFFNFVMKLEFNPKVMADDDKNTIYLLDEPGSYLHASAQAKLCRKLKTLSERNRVIYCTHSHYLLDPAFIPLSSIRVADKNANGDIRLVPIFEHKGNILERRSAFQPVIDALEIKPFILDLNAERMIIVEGICDYYAFEVFKGARPVSILPSVGASSIKFYVSLMLAWQLNFWALWDNDDEGRRCYEEAARLFGEEVSNRRFRLLPLPAGEKKTILQDLFDGSDVAILRGALGLRKDASFDKVMASMYYSSERATLIGQISHKTKQRFEAVFDGFLLE